MAGKLSKLEAFNHLVCNIFLPLRLPQSELEDGPSHQVDLLIARTIIESIHQYKIEDTTDIFQWDCMARMVERLASYIVIPLSKSSVARDMANMNAHDVLALHIRAQNACVIVRKGPNSTIFSIFEVQVSAETVMSNPGKLLLHYPGPAVEIPNSIAEDSGFQEEVANFLAQSSTNSFEEALPTTRKARSTIRETRDTADPNYFTQLLLGILGGMGTVFCPSRINKRIADEVLWNDARNPWRRSPIWLIIRVALQTSLDSILTYKHFMAFHHTYIITQCLDLFGEEFSSEVLFMMRAKMARRLLKLQDSAPSFLVEAAQLAAEGVQDLLQERWTAVQEEQAQSPMWNPSTFDLAAATNITLPTSRASLNTIFRGHHQQIQSSRFTPSEPPRLDNVKDLSEYANGALNRSFSTHSHNALFDFESYVLERLSTWVLTKLDDPENACRVVYSCFQQYISSALSHYTVDVADQSIMILTVMTLWVAIDQLATSDCELLLQFPPEVPATILDPLLLRSSHHLEQARLIQMYIISRQRQVRPTNSSVFSGKTNSHSFAVQYFQQSTTLQELKLDIEASAEKDKLAKIEELKKKNEESARLAKQAAEQEHEYTRVGNPSWGYGSVNNRPLKHDRYCSRCSLERMSRGLTISPHEWPLPTYEQEAEAVVFELRRPKSFATWRDATYQVLWDLGTELKNKNTVSMKGTIESYSGLQSWRSSPNNRARITLGSSTKSFNRSHYSTVTIPASQSSVCVNNGLTFQLYDQNSHILASDPFVAPSFARYGTLKLPKSSPYQHLDYAVKGTTHTSNQVIADQHDCPKDLSLHEHIAFGTLRSGPRLQWLNILRGLEEGILTFNRAEVGLLHAQAAWQIGPFSEDLCLREWHAELEEPKFRDRFIAQCFNLLDQVQGNWLEANSVSLIVLLATRLLASTQPDESESAYKLLRAARRVVFRWLSELQEKLHGAQKKENVINFQYLTCEVALTCRSTFDVGSLHLPHVLRTQEDFVALINSAIILHDNQPSGTHATQIGFRVRLCREYRFAHQVTPYILRLLRQDRHLFSKPLSLVWPGYKQNPEGWKSITGPNKCWVSTTTIASEGTRSQIAHLNLLNGRLLIDGKPLSCLPRHYYENSTYTRLFGERILHVVPANAKGMEFATRDHVHGHEVFFALDKTRRHLIIQARKDGETFQLVDHSQISADLPEFFSTDYHHWAHLEAKTIEFRPLSHPWSSEHCQWRISLCANGRASMDNLGDGSTLVDIHSSVFRSIASLLAPLELDRYLHVTLGSCKPLLHVSLPRMKLQFFINEELQLESYNFREQIIDANQSTGALFGLRNQLVLCAKRTTAQLLSRSRSVLVPHGDISIVSHGHHVLVTIQSGSDRSIPFHRYQLDTDLGYLASNTGLTSRLFKIYLHALTSHCLPDPITQRTGTEEALYELDEPATSSFEQINKTQAELLGFIGSLTPKREYYPAHLTRMQKTSWKNIPALSQHYGFSTAAADILRRSESLRLFFPLGFKPMDFSFSTTEVLFKRAAQRATPFYPGNTANQCVDMTTENTSGDSDRSIVVHERLLLNWGSESRSAAWAFRTLLHGQSQPVHTPCNLVSKAEAWGSLSGPRRDLSLTYSAQWLNISLSETWITMYNLLRQAGRSGNFYGASICLAVGLFSQKISLKDLLVLVSFATNPAFYHLDPPRHASYYLRQDGYAPEISRVRGIISSNARHISSTPAANLIQRVDESNYQFKARKEAQYKTRVSEYLAAMAKYYFEQWPSTHPTSPTQSYSYSSWFTIESCTSEVARYFTSCAHNVEIRDHLREVQHIVSSGPVMPQPQVSSASAIRAHGETQDPGRHTPSILAKELSFGQLMVARPNPEYEVHAVPPRITLGDRLGAPIVTSRLATLFNEFQASKNPCNRRYGQELDASREELCSKRTVAPPEHLPPLETFIEHDQLCKAHLEAALTKVEQALGPTNGVQRIVSISGVWPRLTPRTVLGALSLKSRIQYNMSSAWQSIFIGYARAFVEYQRSRRLVGLAGSRNTEELWKELDESGSDSDPGMCHSDWLLVQIEGNFRARTVQRRVAHEMISPSSSTNTALQLNMGEGKSSVIVPIIAAVLADTKKLVRVIVLKPLWRQMFHLLVNRLSGLVHRRIYYLPFSRDVQLDSSQANRLRGLYAECMREGGILLAQPEHILSFKLMGIDHLVSGSQSKRSASNQLRDIQTWLTANTRDILDESDEILHVRYQLVYTVGTQHPLENHPDRWTVIQQLLQIVERNILRLKDSNPETIEYRTRGAGRYPAIRIMADCDQDVEDALITSIVKDVLDGRLLSLNFSRLPRSARQLINRFLTVKDISYMESRELLQECDEVMWKGLLLLRGILALGVLVFALKSKRYRVDYGLDLTRSLLAVPFRAKDVPSLRAEFGHPDVAVLLTCLSYYYKGLTNDQLERYFELVYKLDNPPLEYEQWVRSGGTVPTDLQQLNGINAKDREQFVTKIVPVFSHNSAVIDFFLSSVVFPKAAKEFPHKLATSGWDLAESKAHVTTGFSGTNDNRYLLPTSITQSDPVQQLSTNALVLTYILRPENNHYLCMRDKSGESFTTKQFLKLLVDQQPEVRVLLDVGAQMLELRNEELVRRWLDMRPDIEAAVCFNEEDELIVVPQSGTTSAFYSSPYSQQLDKCIVYLDDGHTRGTDLKLPRHTRALVTLGPKVTKDRLLQGCMRMRKLGHGQSVIFAAPPEIDRQIRNSAPQPLDFESKIDTIDILRWAMLETCKDLQHHVSNWAQQGLEHDRRVKAEALYGSCKDVGVLKAGWVTPESRSLEEMYGVQDPSNPSPSSAFASQVLAIPEFQKRLAVFGPIALHGSRIDEEQEREVSHEIEREQQVEYPSKERAAEHGLHRDVISFAKTGQIPEKATGINSLFGPLCSTNSRTRNPWSNRIFASVDFSKTVTRALPNSLSDYMRPVNWVLRGAGGIRLVLSPFEVNKLLPLIRRSEVVQLHVYAPRTTHLMKSFSDLKFYCIPHTQPTLPRTSALSRNQLQLDLFAGQLYLPSYQAYGILCAILGIYNTSHDQDDDPDIQTKSDGFLPMEYRQQIAEVHPDYAKCAFAISPVPVLKELIGRRRKGMEYTKTHLGQVLYSRSMTPNDF